MLSKTSCNLIKKMDVPERISEAESKTDQLWRYIVDLIQTHENNHYLFYRDTLPSQIPSSRAASAFNYLQYTMFLGEITKLAALWDKLDLEKCCIPTIIALIDHPSVKRQLYRRHAAYAAALPAMLDTKLDWTLIIDGTNARKRYWRSELATIRKRFMHYWKIGVRLGQVVPQSQRLKNIRDYRARAFAHNLDLSYLSVSSKVYVPPKCGQEKRLLQTTIYVANGLNGAIRNASFLYESSRKICSSSSKSLWEGCILNVIE